MPTPHQIFKEKLSIYRQTYKTINEHNSLIRMEPDLREMLNVSDAMDMLQHYDSIDCEQYLSNICIQSRGVLTHE